MGLSMNVTPANEYAFGSTCIACLVKVQSAAYVAVRQMNTHRTFDGTTAACHSAEALCQTG